MHSYFTQSAISFETNHRNYRIFQFRLSSEETTKALKRYQMDGIANDSLQFLDLSDIDINAKHLDFILKNFTSLKSLILSSKQIGNSHFQYLCEKMPQIEFLELLIDPEVISADNFSKLNHLKNLKFLSLKFQSTRSEFSYSGDPIALDYGTREENLGFLKNLKSLQLSFHFKYKDGLSDFYYDCIAEETPLLPFLKQLANIETLTLEHCYLNNEAFLTLANLKSLKTLDLSSVIGDISISSLKSLTNLESLCLKNTEIMDSDLTEMNHLKNLTHLDLSHCENITEDGLKNLTLDKLEVLDLTNRPPYEASKITDISLTHLAKFKNLRRLSLGSSVVTYDGLRKNLAFLTNLTYLDLSYCEKLTREHIEKLQTEFPNLEINFR